MLQVALAQVRLNARRFIAVSLAVLIAVGFLTATLIINSSSKASLTQSVGGAYRNADLLITRDMYVDDAAVLDEDTAAGVRDTPGVEEIYAAQQSFVTFSQDRGSVFAQLGNTSDSAELFPVEVLQGTLPTSDSEVAVDRDTAERYDLMEGSVLGITASLADAAPATAQLTVTALVSTSGDPQVRGTPQLYSTGATVARFAEPEAGLRSIQVAVADGAAVEDVRTALQEDLSGLAGIDVRTPQEQTDDMVASFTGGNNILTTILMAFAAVALLVCALVVSNTFSVLVAQRTRELALLRCIGAARSQIRRSVIVEALIIGIVASAAGVLAAVGLVGGTIAYLRTLPDSGFATLSVSPLSVVAGLVTGILLTVLASLVPARAATAVAPLAALRPAEDIRAGTRRGRVRLGIGLVLLAVGSALLGIGAVRSDLIIALPGGILSFVGVLMCATLFVPSLVRTVGRIAAPLGVPGKLAAVNAVRNPQRTSATSAALLIGVTLVTMMMTGAATVRTSLDDVLTAEYPVDIAVSGGTAVGGTADAASPFTSADVEAALAVDGVQEAVLLPVGGVAQLRGGPFAVYAVDPSDAAKVLRDSSLVPEGNTILMPEGIDAKTLTVRGADSSVELDVVVSDSSNMLPLISTSTAESLGGPPLDDPNQPLPQMWLSVAEGLATNALIDLRTDVAEALDVDDYAVSGSAIERGAFEQVINVLLMVVTGLLGVAVVIALVGVANTLSLSVLERTRESSLLRALGLTRGQLRGMLALEAVLIAGVAALMGSVLGSLYGWLGAQSALGSFTTVAPSLPWLQLLAVLAVALLAGLGASVLPARRAARLSPVAGLAAD
ncbi:MULTISPECIES: FtsX-like permease family protein [unclassified Arthrobacter]|uniref:ABC transporter permease n=1 Tax=unclassified Arthrobacter TaxID=235627 RepID=UPI001E2CE234|nr:MULTISPECIES: FtsX-like permease family protein [unclassified Arthrobacter]MCC9146625.1 FtsX-like permease family protein [Arthrobacter sp. zg-Y919]MDK1277855.1 FtsX-like permease family protein [Arthrobacter sp. zg.Y919]WIB02194.1 FtsX-like permease family protein [Arthrobacter sp. zg-Y919]